MRVDQRQAEFRRFRSPEGGGTPWDCGIATVGTGPCGVRGLISLREVDRGGNLSTLRPPAVLRKNERSAMYVILPENGNWPSTARSALQLGAAAGRRPCHRP